MNVVVVIEGREAIPVRAIPLLTNWRFMSPDIVAHVLGGTGGSNVGLFGDMQSNCIEGGKVKLIDKDWWAQFAVTEFRALSTKIKRKELDDDVGRLEWRRKSLKELPAGVFVWKDEYQKLHDENWYSRFQMLYGGLRYPRNEEDDNESTEEFEAKMLSDSPHKDFVHDDPLKRELWSSLEVLKRWREPNYAPFMRPDLYAVAMEGFEYPTIKAKELEISENTENVEASTARKNRLDEMLKTHLEQLSDPIYQREDKRINELLIEWRKAFALREEWENSDPRGIPSEIERKKVGLDMAMRQYEALDAQVKMERGDGAPENTNAQPQEITPSPAPAPQATPVGAVGAFGGVAPWKLKAQERAHEIIKRDKAKDLYPSQLNIADEIATVFRKDGVIGAGGKPLTGEYIKRHALKGITSEQDKQLSTAIGRGK